MRIRVVAACAVLGIVSLMCGGTTASAHQGVELTSADTTPARGPLLVDGTVSFAVRTDISRGDQRGFRFRLSDGDDVAIQLLIVDEPPGNQLPSSKLPRVNVVYPTGKRTRMVINERTEFYEPYGGTTYWYLSRLEGEAVAGTYRVTVSGRSKQPVEAVIAVGYREVPGQVRR